MDRKNLDQNKRHDWYREVHARMAMTNEACIDQQKVNIMNRPIKFLSILFVFVLVSCALGPKQQEHVESEITVNPPIMGWSSWNYYHINIDEDIIKSQADAIANSGMKEVGYMFVNIDDGYFGGRDESGDLLVHKERFPLGMKALATYIHSKGLKAGIYSDAGINTCGSHWDKDSISVGCGLYGHDYQDLKKMLRDWDYDFIKVDWCGGDWLGLDVETRYTEISRMIHKLKPTTIFNICRWMFPGKWAVQVANSWRISGDISPSFESITQIIDLNADLWRFCGPNHYNDMDMLQVGQGMSYEEDKTHFTMWCMMVSPLLAGNDLTTMSEETLGILTNKDVIALDQDPLFYQARRLIDNGDLEVWAKPLIHTMSGRVAVTLLNRSAEAADIPFALNRVGLDASKGYTLCDLWSKEDFPLSRAKECTFNVPSHGVVTLLVTGEALPHNVFQLE